MANRYGEAALMAARAEAEYRSHPAERWKEMIERLYPTSPIAQRKSGPRGMFLGLCGAGLVRGIPAGQYAGSNKTAIEKAKGQALQAVSLLREGKRASAAGLWTAVNDGEEIPHTGQMDVLLALWKNDLIVT